MRMASTEGIQATNDDATGCKRFAVEKGYWEDPYISLFTIGRPLQSRTPEINRGYFARVHGTKLLLDKFVKIAGGSAQIVNLGAGFDTLYWRLCDEGCHIPCFIDVDLPTTTTRKCHCIRSKRPLLNRLQQNNAEILFNQTDLHARPYHLVAADIADVSQLHDKLVTHSLLDASLPTLFLAECVLVYLPVAKSNLLLRWITDHFQTAFFINYEQVNMADRFGEVMRENLRTRDCELSGADACASLEAQKSRFTSQGFDGSDALEMTDVYRRLPANEVTRYSGTVMFTDKGQLSAQICSSGIEKLEMLDDTEVFEQLLKHYCISWAYKDGQQIGLSTISV